MSVDADKLRALVRQKNWDGAYAMLDEARQRATTSDERWQEVYWRGATLRRQQRYEEALDLLRMNVSDFGSKSLVQSEVANLLLKLGRDQEALDALSKVPFEDEMRSFYGLAIDAKFFYFYLLAKSGDASVKDRLTEIPDDYRHIAMGGTFLTKGDIVALLDRK